jgi:hypothetical protein
MKVAFIWIVRVCVAEYHGIPYEVTLRHGGVRGLASLGSYEEGY